MSESQMTWQGKPLRELTREELIALIETMARTMALQNYLLERAECREPWPVAGSA